MKFTGKYCENPSDYDMPIGYLGCRSVCSCRFCKAIFSDSICCCIGVEICSECGRDNRIQMNEVRWSEPNEYGTRINLDYLEDKNKMWDELEGVALKEHYRCEDNYYSCPLAEDGCSNDLEYKSLCNCGANTDNARIKELISKLRGEAIWPH